MEGQVFPIFDTGSVFDMEIRSKILRTYDTNNNANIINNMQTLYYTMEAEQAKVQLTNITSDQSKHRTLTSLHVYPNEIIVSNEIIPK